MRVSNSAREDAAFATWREEGTGIEELVELLQSHAEAVTMDILHEADEDIALEAVCKVMEKCGSFKGESKFSTWFHSIVVNLCKMRIRERVRRNEVPLLEDSAVGEIPDSFGFGEARGALNEEEQAVFDSWKEGASVEESAKELGVTKQAVKLAREHVRTKVRRLYGREAGE